MPRIACLLVPDLPVAAACRADPELAGRPLVLVDGSGPHAHVIAASRGALARGVQPGRHTVAQARALAADLVVRTRDAAAERSAAHALAEVAASLAIHHHKLCPRLKLSTRHNQMSQRSVVYMSAVSEMSYE